MNARRWVEFVDDTDTILLYLRGKVICKMEQGPSETVILTFVNKMEVTATAEGLLTWLIQSPSTSAS